MADIIQSIFYRQITSGDFWNVERRAGTGPIGGGGKTYFDIPIGGNLMIDQLHSFLNISPNDPWPPATIPVKVLGNPDVSHSLEFAPRQSQRRYKISNQARQQTGSNRHPAWSANNGFPQAPDDIASKDDSNIPNVANLKIYVVKTQSNEYYASFVDSASLPTMWPHGMGLEKMFQNGVSAGLLQFANYGGTDIPPLVRQILAIWKQQPNVLLYGPPGTGKTYAMQILWQLLNSQQSLSGLALDPDSKDEPFTKIEVELPFEKPVRAEWITFHQNYSYENFILALRPASNTSTLQLKPRTGTLLDAAISVDPVIEQPANLKYKSAVIFIDEINRGNVSRIFGEFLTFMDLEYRADSHLPPLPVPLPNVRYQKDDKSEAIERLRGPDVHLPFPWYFPKNVYVIASMNSVDRAVAPLDTALARRFARIEVGPDMKQLADELGLEDTSKLLGKSQETEAEMSEEDDNDE